MGGAIRRHWDRPWFLAALFVLLSLAGTPAAMAQQGTATVNGVVKDPTGAAIPNARVELTNVGTSVVRTTSTNGDGAYAFPSVVPGVYTMQASATGFSTVTQPQTTLEVSQTATFDFQMTVGTAQQNITVNAAEGAALETATSELGTVVNTKEVTDLPLNGRNFTQLLTVTAGVANINRDQSASGGSGWAGSSLGSFTFPAVNGARNRSNYFILDGENDLNTMLGMYNYSPIVDAIQEFKTQGHNDLAEYGGAAGGIVSVVTKSGTNQFHGALWEFLRNADMDARGYFQSTLPPLKQNQYGASVGGPVWIPKVYDGKNKTFFYAAFEGFQIRSAITSGALAPTAAERSGDFSALGVPIYDPATTTLNPATGTYSRTAFPGGIIPANRISPISALFQTLIPQAGPLVNGNNVYSSGPASTSQNSGTARGDQNFGNNNQLSFRFSDFGQNVANTTSIVGLNTIYIFGHNYVGHWTHTFSPTAFSDVYFGRNYGVTTTGTEFPGETPAFLSQLQTLGMSTSWMTLNNKLYAPQWTADNYLSLSGSQLQQTGLADNWQWGGTFTKIIGKHTIKGGGDFQSNNFRSPIAYSSAAFGTAQTAGLGAEQGIGGNAWASLLLGVPREASYRNILEVAGGGWIDGLFAQDQFKATSRLTINVGFRNDFVWTPIYGTGNGANFYTGNADPLTGQYELNALPPNCSATQGAPCIPTGTYTASTTPAPGGLPAHAYVNPASDHRVIRNSLFDWAGRLGLAYRLGDKMVIRSSYSRFYDAWATTVQLSQNFGGNWPAVNTLDNAGLNVNVPTAPANDPLRLGSGGTIIYPINDFSQVSQWMVDPNFRTPYMDQWNVGIERELPANSVLDVNYVGSVGRHLDWGPIMNTPPPGPGPVQARRPYPYMLQQWFDQSVGNSRYNALQVTLNKRTSHGVTFLLAYTLSHSNDDGCGLGANCNSTQPYNRSADYGTSDTNQTNAFSAAFTLQSPFTTSSDKWVSNLAGGWALNGIVQIASGWPYTIVNSGDPENVGSISQERVNVVGKPNSGPGLHTAAQWFNVNAFALQAPYTYGNEKVNPLTSDGTKNLDLSLFRTFHVGLGESRYFEFRAEAFNLFNRVMFSIPNNSLGGANFGAVTGTVTGSTNGLGGQQNQPRQLQLALKFIY
jgi:hypothetical protein